jgi:acarbose 7IV-phosphotransferase
MKHIFIIGGTTFDHIVSMPEFLKPIPQTIHQAAFHETIGSTGAGKALCLKKLDVPSTLYSLLGNDSYGQKIIQHLKDEKVDFFFDIDPRGTERHFNMMDAQGSRISIFITQSSEFPTVDHNRVEDMIRKSDILVLNIISYCKLFISVLSQCNKPVWTDLHDYNEGNPYHQPFIEVSGFIFLSSDNLTDYKKTMKNLMQKGKELVVCTHGKNGATALTKQGQWFEEPALSGFPVIDTNGAGDNFFSGFLHAHLNGKSIKECMQYGTLCAALCITSTQLVYENLTSSFLEKEYKSHY